MFWKKKPPQVIADPVQRFRERLAAGDKNFEEVDLHAAKLVGLDLTDADFSRANLEEAVLDDSILSSAIFRFANLQKTSLKRATLDKLPLLVRADLFEADFTEATVAGVIFNECCLISTKFESCIMGRVEFAGSLLTNTQFFGVCLAFCHFDEAIYTLEKRQLPNRIDLATLKFTARPFQDTSLPSDVADCLGQREALQRFFASCGEEEAVITKLFLETTEEPLPKRDEFEFDVFISFKNLDASGNESEDAKLGQKVYEFLTAQGLRVFFSKETLEQMGVSEYKFAIDSALDRSRCLVAVGTSKTHLESKWVRYEWDSFINDILSGYKLGKVFSYVSSLPPKDLPRSLRQRESFDDQDASALPRLLNFIKNAT